MGEYPKGGLIGKTVRIWRSVQVMEVPLHAANACYFIVLAVFPALLLLLSLLRHTPLEVETLAELFYGFLPEALSEGAEELILLTWDNTNGTLLGVSAVTALWSAGRGIYGILTGLNSIYGVSERRGYFHIRLLSMLYMVGFLVLLLLTLGLHVFSAELAALLGRMAYPGLLFLGKVINFRLWVLLGLQTALFTAMYVALPGGKQRIGQSIPGALLASAGWQVFSNLYSIYMEYVTGLRNVYGSVYAVAVSMLWLYCCMSIVFYGAVLNVLLKDRKF